MQLPYYVALHNALRALFALTVALTLHFKNQYFENDKREK